MIGLKGDPQIYTKSSPLSHGQNMTEDTQNATANLT